MRTQPRAPLHTTCARYGTTQNFGGRRVRGSNGGVRCARKSDPMNDRATTYVHHNGKWLCRQMKKPEGENR